MKRYINLWKTSVGFNKMSRKQRKETMVFVILLPISFFLSLITPWFTILFAVVVYAANISDIYVEE